MLKPSGDGSERVVEEFQGRLPIELVIQEEGFAASAYHMAIKKSSGDLLLFIDDDAIAEERWVEKYVELFSKIPDAGGFCGETYRAVLEGGKLVLLNERFHLNKITRQIFYRKPLPEFRDYCEWISISGFMGVVECCGEIFKSTSFGGVNMGFLRSAIMGCPLDELYSWSRKAFGFEQALCYCVRREGYHTYRVVGEDSPRVWHIEHGSSLTRGAGFWHEFWLHCDRASMYFRLKKLGAKVSLPAYIAALVATARKKPIPRLLATIYSITRNLIQDLRP